MEQADEEVLNGPAYECPSSTLGAGIEVGSPVEWGEGGVSVGAASGDLPCHSTLHNQMWLTIPMVCTRSLRYGAVQTAEYVR